MKADEDLMRYLDGELGPREARLVEERLATNPAEQDKLAGLEQLRAAVRARYDGVADEAPMERVWRRIERELDAPKSNDVSAERRRSWHPSLRGYLLTSVVSAAAGAAIALFASSHGNGRGPFAPTHQSAEVENLEVTDGMGTILQIPGGEKEAPTTVIWVTPEEPIAVPAGEDPI